MTAPAGSEIEAIRAFNRFYTRTVRVLDEGYMASPFSLAEVRVLYELAHGSDLTAGQLARDLDLDPGYLSRILRGFKERGLVGREPSSSDGRQVLLRLTDAGSDAFAPLEARTRQQIADLLAPLPDGERHRLISAMSTIRRILDPAPDPEPYLLRTHGSGDLGWIVQRHGILYAQEYGWDATFEGLVAQIVAGFVANQDPACECCWIAERYGENIGSVMLVKHPEREGVAKLRLLIVDPSARGMGVGRRLVDECIRFARQAGYHTITLWTNSILTAARRIYATAGFQLVESHLEPNFGKALVSETWELAL